MLGLTQVGSPQRTWPRSTTMKGVLFIGKAQEKSTVFHAEKRHGPETKRRWSAWSCLTWRCANSGSIASAHCGGRAKNIRCKNCLREDTVGGDRVAMAATGDQADDVLAVAYGGAATGLGPHHGQRHR
jgi:hypothetical protein